jgi:hypothetical protein
LFFLGFRKFSACLESGRNEGDSCPLRSHGICEPRERRVMDPFRPA